MGRGRRRAKGAENAAHGSAIQGGSRPVGKALCCAGADGPEATLAKRHEGARPMSKARLDGIADRIVSARRRGARVALLPSDTPMSFEEGFAVQDKVVAALAEPPVGWKVMQVPDGPVIFAPILRSGLVPAGGTWKVTGSEPAGIELEVAFRLGRDVPAGATEARLLDAVAAAHVVFELCQSRLAEPAKQPRHVMLADCIANAGLVVGDEIAGWRNLDLRGRSGRLL